MLGVGPKPLSIVFKGQPILIEREDARSYVIFIFSWFNSSNISHCSVATQEGKKGNTFTAEGPKTFLTTPQSQFM